MGQEVYINSIMDLPKPDIQSTCTIDSDTAIISHAGLIHIIKLPKIGDYAYEFKLWSNCIINAIHNSTINVNSIMTPMLLDNNYNYNYNYEHGYGYGYDIYENGCIHNGERGFSHKCVYDGCRLVYEHNKCHNPDIRIYDVDSILNYIDTISLCIGGPDSILSYIDHIQLPKTRLTHDIQNSKSGIIIDFLPDTPLITRAMGNMDIYLVVKFNRIPCIKYYFSFEVGFISNEFVQRELEGYSLIVPGNVFYDGTIKRCNFIYANGMLSGYEI